MFGKEEVLKVQKPNLLCRWRRQSVSCLPLEWCVGFHGLRSWTVFVVCWKVPIETSFSFGWSTRSFGVFWFWSNFLICLLLFTFLQQKSLLDVSKEKNFWPFCHFTVCALLKEKGQKLGFSSRKTFPKKKSSWPLCNFTVCVLFKEKGQKPGFSSLQTVFLGEKWTVDLWV